MTASNSGSQVDQNVLTALLDRLLPAVDDLPAAGQMGFADEIVRLAGTQARFERLFSKAMASFSEMNPSFTDDDGTKQDAAITAFEADQPKLFGVLRDVSYIVYYKDSRVHDRIGWDGKPPQPDGNEMTPWDESVLDNMRKREPFWRKV